MKEIIKKFIKELFSKYLITIAVCLTTLFASSIIAGVKMYISVPAQIQHLEQIHVQDSTMASQYMLATSHKFDSILKVLSNHGSWLEEDYRDIQKLKTKNKIK